MNNIKDFLNENPIISVIIVASSCIVAVFGASEFLRVHPKELIIQRKNATIEQKNSLIENIKNSMGKKKAALIEFGKKIEELKKENNKLEKCCKMAAVQKHIPTEKKSEVFTYKTVNINSKQLWSGKGIVLKSGDYVKIIAKGKINLNKKIECEPDGYYKYSWREKYSQFEDYNTGSLIARIGGINKPFLVGKGTGFKVKDTNEGFLEFGINDKKLSDNEGEFTVDIEISGSK
ncbi:MAG: hypothetical protein GY795_13220 [Desulfobacterales bacterium]|nr:hypothetical protein [Desulfobacterales bacterium]